MAQIFLADKPTLDATKAQVDLIKPKTDLIGSPNPTNADTSTVMNYLKQLESKLANFSGGTDWSKYTPTHLARYERGTTSLKTVLNITGKGYLSNASVTVVNADYKSTLKVTIDGVVTFHAVGYGSNLCVNNPSTFFTDDTMFIYPSSALQSSNTNESKSVILPQPLFFKSSLKVEVAINDSTLNLRYGVRYALEN